MAIDRNSPIPIYHQLKTLILKKIETGIWRPGDRIDTEQQLCQAYGISRAPVRQALNELTYEGLLIRRAGQGTFVNDAYAAPVGEPIEVMWLDFDWSDLLDLVSQTWNQRHPTRRIAFDVSRFEREELYKLVSAAIGSGTAPDLAQVDCAWVAGLAQSGFLYSLDELTPQWDQAEFEQSLHPPLIEANSVGGKMYGLPVLADASVLWYRKDWLDREGIVPPRTWDDLVEVASRFLEPDLQKRYSVRYPLVFPAGAAGGEATVYRLMPFIWSSGGAIFDGDTVVLDSPFTRRAVQFLRDLTVHGVCPPEVTTFGSRTPSDLFIEGKVAMTLGGSYESTSICTATGWEKEEFVRRVACVPPPAAPGGQSVSTVGGLSYVIPRQCQRPALMLEVLQMAIDPQVVGEMYRTLWANAPYPSFDAVFDPEREPHLLETSRMIASARVRPAIPEYVIVSRQLQAMFEAAIATDEPVEQIVRRTAEFIGIATSKSLRSS